jgi:hypothetical protein
MNYQLEASGLSDVDSHRLTLLAESYEADPHRCALSGVRSKSSGIKKGQQLFVPRPCERCQLKWIEKDSLAAARVANQEARTIAAIVTIDLNRSEFAVEFHRQTSTRLDEK